MFEVRRSSSRASDAWTSINHTYYKAMEEGPVISAESGDTHRTSVTSDIDFGCKLVASTSHLPEV